MATNRMPGEGALLIINADDYGYWPSYNEGILAAAEAGAIDSVSAMVEREHCVAVDLLATEVEVGLHLEFEGRWGPRSGGPARSAVRVQLERFADLFGSWPAFIDGHHDCHARPELATPVLEAALQIGCPVRSVGRDHRQWLSERGIETPDMVIGRMSSGEPVEPPALRNLPMGVCEWIVHPGYPDAASGSSYDLARKEDLEFLTRLQVRARFDEPVWGAAKRTTHRLAFTPDQPEEAD